MASPTDAAGIADQSELREILLDGRPVALTVKGYCMAPTLADGQLITALRAREPHPGDVALLEAGGVLEVHRLLDRVHARSGTWFIHSGDAPGSRPGVVDGRNVLGIVAAPPGGAVSLRARLLGFALRVRVLVRLLW